MDKTDMVQKEELTYEEVLAHVFGDRRVPIHLLYRLSDLSPAEFESFAAQWPQADESRRRVIARHMADISEENFVVDFSPLFRLLLQDPEADVRLAALDGLWDCENRALVRPIIDLMERDADTRVRALAAATLGHIVLMGEWGQLDRDVAGEAVDSMLAVYEDPFTPDDVRRAALESLGAAAHEQVPDIISRAYHSGNEALQLSAVFAMGRSADSRWLPIVMEELESYDDEMRVEAARAAGGIGSSDAVEKLIDLIEDEELEVRLAAVYALGQIGSERAYEALQPLLSDPGISEQMLQAVETVLEEMSWLTGEIDFSLLEWDDDEA